jgi:hypothetical protein
MPCLASPRAAAAAAGSPQTQIPLDRAAMYFDSNASMIASIETHHTHKLAEKDFDGEISGHRKS